MTCHDKGGELVLGEWEVIADLEDRFIVEGGWDVVERGWDVVTAID